MINPFPNLVTAFDGVAVSDSIGAQESIESSAANAAKSATTFNSIVDSAKVASAASQTSFSDVLESKLEDIVGRQSIIQIDVDVRHLA